MRVAACTWVSLVVSMLSLRGDLLFVDFETSTLGDYTKSDLLVDWGAGTSVFQGVDDDPSDGTDDGRVSIVNDPTGGTNRVLEVRYPKDASSSAHSGASWSYNFTTETEVWAQYDVFIPGGTEFVRGGKLPGLAGGNRDDNPGFSNRMMWRSTSVDGETSGGATAPVGSANLVYYTHHPALPSGAQDDFQWTDIGSGAWLEPTTGEWHTVTQQVVLDSPGSNDGIIRGYWDGALMSEEVVGLTDDSYGIDQFYFSTFYGGNDATWAPKTGQKFYFDNFEVSTSALILPVAVPEPSGVLCGGIVLAIGMMRSRRRPRARTASRSL